MRSILHIAVKELQISVRTPRFLLIVLILIPLFAGVTALECNKFSLQQAAYEAALQTQADGFRAIKDYWRMTRSFLTAFRPPNPLTLIASGTSRELADTFFMYNVNNAPDQRTMLIRNSFNRLYGDWDLGRIIIVILSFLALLLSHDALSGEKQEGTIRMLCAAPISRSTFVFGKFLGLTATLAIVVVTAIVISALEVMFLLPGQSRILLPALFLMAVMALLFAALFIALGVTASALTHRTLNSLAACIALWILFVLAFPQFIALAAVSANPAMSSAQITARSDELVTEYLAGFRQVPSGNTPEEKIAFRRHWFSITRKYQEGLRRLWQDTSNSLRAQESTARDLSWCSPSSAMALSLTSLSETNPAAEIRAVNAVWNVVLSYVDYLEERLMPDLEEMYRTGQPLRKYASGIDWDGIPKADFRSSDSTVSQVLALFHGVLVMLVWLAVLLSLSVLFARGYDPR